MERRAVVEHERRLRRERGDEPVPHHPAARREVEDAVAAADVAVELVLLQVLEQRAAGAVDDALRHAGGAGRIQDVERVVERQPLEASSSASSRGRATRPTDASPSSRGDASRRRHRRSTAPHTRQPRSDLRDFGSAVEALAAVVVAVDRERARRARSGRSDRGRPARRNPASTTTTRRRSPRRRARRRSPRACSPTMPRDAIAGRTPAARSAAAARPTSRAKLAERERAARARLGGRDESPTASSRRRRTFSVKFSRRVGKERAPGMRSGSRRPRDRRARR